MPRQSLADWVELAAFWLRPIYEEIKTRIFEAGYAQVDETPVKYLAPGLGKTGQGYLWAVCVGPAKVSSSIGKPAGVPTV